jgi:hypothetical protein
MLRLKPITSLEEAKIVARFRRLLRSMPDNEARQFARALYTLAHCQEQQEDWNAYRAKAAQAVAGA